MKHILKHGTSQPSTNDLDPFQLGWCTSTKKLYINDDGKIRIVSSTVKLEENTAITTKGSSINKNDIFSMSALTEDHINITLSHNFANNQFNIKLIPTDDREFTLSEAIAHQEYNSSSGFKSETAFASLTTSGIDFNIGNFSNAIDYNIYFEMIFTIREYDYKVEFRVADEDQETVSAIMTLSRTLSQ